MILIDTSGALAALDADQADHAAAAEQLTSASGPRLLSPFVLAELDYLIATRIGQEAEVAFLAEVARRAYQLEPFSADDIAAAHALIQQHGDLRLGLAEASIVVLARRHGARDILTLDQRHFRRVNGRGGRPFRLLPADA